MCGIGYHRQPSAPRQAECPGRNTFALAAALAFKSGNNKIKLYMPCHQQRTGTATASYVQMFQCCTL